MSCRDLTWGAEMVVPVMSTRVGDMPYWLHISHPDYHAAKTSIMAATNMIVTQPTEAIVRCDVSNILNIEQLH